MANKKEKITFIEGKNYRWIANTIAEKTNNTYEEVTEFLNKIKQIETLLKTETDIEKLCF